MKRILSLITPLLIYAFFFTSTIANAQGSSVAYKFESDGIIYEIISGKDCGVVYNSLNKYTGSIVIPEFVTYNGTTYNVKWICSGAFYECTGLTSITIPESVDIIENRAFYRCINLNSISLGSKVFRIGNDAFAWCQNLTSITIPASVQSIGDNAFYQCSSLANIKISESIVTIGSDAFTGTPWYHNQEDGLIYVGKVIEILKAYRPLELARQLLYEIELPRVVVNALKDNESEERTTTEFKVRRVLEKIPLINLYYVYKHHSSIRENRNAIDN